MTTGLGNLEGAVTGSNYRMKVPSRPSSGSPQAVSAQENPPFHHLLLLTFQYSLGLLKSHLYNKICCFCALLGTRDKLITHGPTGL